MYKAENKSALGGHIKIKIDAEVSVLWSVIPPFGALAELTKSALTIVYHAKEFAMSKLHEIVTYGVALLSVPGRIDICQFG